MAILISNAELAIFESGVASHFETFSSFHSLLIIKEPKKIVVDNNADIYPGYESNSNVNNFTLIPVTGVFNCMVMDAQGTFESELFEYVPVGITAGDRVIKVEQPAKDFLEIGTTERLIVDNKDTYVLKSLGFIKTYGHLTYYYFIIGKTS